MPEFKDICDEIIKKTIKHGADEAEVFLEISRESEVGTRLGEVETIKEASSRGLGLRVIKNKRLGFTYTSDFTESHLESLIKKTIELSEQASEDDFNGLPEPTSETIPDLQLFDPKVAQIETSWKIDACKRMEKTMFDYDKRLTNSEGANFLDGDSTVYIANSKGFYHSFNNSFAYLYCMPVAQQDDKLQSGYWFSFSRYFDELDSPEAVAKIAAERTVRMLGAVTPRSVQAPVVFDPLTAASFVGSLPGAVNGDVIFKRASFLVDKLNQPIASSQVNIRDDGMLVKGLASCPVDGEGLPTRNKAIISQGKLMTYLYDTYTARKAKTTSTANALRGYSSTPSIGGFNFYLESGDYSPKEIIGSVKSGLYLTNLMGFGADIVTGDYSKGASGIWIENGKLTHPVEGLTIAGNMLDMLSNIEMVGNDLKMMGPVSSPTFKISEMVIAGV